jgi:hypothetical protein
MASFDQQGRPVVTASTADVPDLMAADEQDVVIDDLRTRALGECVAAPATERLVDAGYRSVLAVSTDGPKSVVRVAFWSKRPRAFDRTHVPLARRIAYHLGLGASCRELGQLTHRVDERTQQLEVGVQRGVDRLHEGTQLRVIGGSVEWRDVLRKATQVAATHTTVLITGESGTGKEVVARFIHAASPRKNGPFVALNCAALPEQLLESELFGYERGAFTSAQQSKPGLLELASGGVLFLDEVSEMSLSAQAKFLRVLQEREFQRLGGTRLLKANIRVIAATNRDLRNAAERGDFREDLFYRIGVFDIRIPPLRDRSSDILPLSEAFLQDIGRSFGRPPAGLTRGGATRPSSLRLSRERARASQRSGAGRDPLRRWAHRPEPSLKNSVRKNRPPMGWAPRLTTACGRRRPSDHEVPAAESRNVRPTESTHTPAHALLSAFSSARELVCAVTCLESTEEVARRSLLSRLTCHRLTPCRCFELPGFSSFSIMGHSHSTTDRLFH